MVKRVACMMMNQVMIVTKNTRRSKVGQRSCWLLFDVLKLLGAEPLLVFQDKLGRVLELVQIKVVCRCRAVQFWSLD